MAYKSFKTVGELIDILKELPADTCILTRNSNTMEQIGYQKGDCINVEIKKFKTEKRWACDAFDGTDYQYDAIFAADEGDANCFEGILL